MKLYKILLKYFASSVDFQFIFQIVLISDKFICVTIKQSSESAHIHGIPRYAVVDQENLPQDDSKHLALINDHFRAQSLKSSMEHLHKEVSNCTLKEK